MLLVTGATGFLGATLVRELVRQGEPVRILRRPTSALDLLGDAAHAVDHAEGDVTDRASVRAALQGCSRVIHAAAFVGFGGESDREQLFAVNVGGTAAVMDEARRAGVQRAVHVSSIAALGRSETPREPIDERATWTPSRANTAYAESKRAAELEVHRAIAEGLDATIGNPALIFGPGRAGENTMQIAEQVRDRKLPAAPSGGTCVVDVADVADGLIRLLEHGRTGERHILGGQNLRWTEILGTLAAAFGVDPPRFTVGLRTALALATASEAVSALTRRRPLLTRETARTAGRFYRYSNQKAVEELGCTFRPFEQTAARIERAAV